MNSHVLALPCKWTGNKMYILVANSWNWIRKTKLTVYDVIQQEKFNKFLIIMFLENILERFLLVTFNFT